MHLAVVSVCTYKLYMGCFFDLAAITEWRFLVEGKGEERGAIRFCL